MPRCSYCDHPFPTSSGVRKHIRQSPACRKQRRKAFTGLYARTLDCDSQVPAQPGATHEESTPDPESLNLAEPGPVYPTVSVEPSTEPSEATSRRPTVEDVEDEDEVDRRRRESKEAWTRYIKSFPPEFKAGMRLGRGKTNFEKLREAQQERGESPLGPFLDEDEWELAQWLVANVGQRATDRFLKLNIVCCLMGIIDRLC